MLSSNTVQHAASLGVADAMLFRRLDTNRWTLVGGLGRGQSWAGLVDITDAEDPTIVGMPTETGAVQWFRYRQPTRVIGPYYAICAAMVRISDDVLVVLGNAHTSLTAWTPDDALRSLGSALDAEISEVAPSKRLADELEVLHAVRSVSAITRPSAAIGTAPSEGADVWGTLADAADVVAAALSCEVAIIRDGSGRIVGTSTWGAIDVTDEDFVNDAMDALQALAGQGAVCIQDSRIADLPEPFDWAHGVRSLMLIPIPGPVGGLLVVAHTMGAARGFTSLCRRIAQQIVEAAAVVAHTALLRTELQQTSRSQSVAARRDPLTGLGNRLAWDEALAGADRFDRGGIAVISLDLDGLEQVNRKSGHQAGNDLLRTCAAILRQLCEPGEIPFRLGGDEFAILLDGAGSRPTDLLRSLRHRLGGVTSRPDEVAASVGLAVESNCERVADVVRDADAAMYAAKRLRRAGAAVGRAHSAVIGVPRQCSASVVARPARTRQRLAS